MRIFILHNIIMHSYFRNFFHSMSHSIHVYSQFAMNNENVRIFAIKTL